ncbi:MAG: tryptophan-rich sensory protein [Candidatus Nomurabacteria bacterium]|nr:tryptophan-rich sensory protein [Candidatus Nomurabacteria bacterium]
MNNTNTTNWYSHLLKPTWAPPSWIFGPVWSFLYIIIFISFGTVFYKVFNKQLPLVVVLPFVLNIIFNISFTYFQFGLKSNILAAIDISLVLVTLVWALISIYPYIRWVALINIPYLLWVMFATVLQFTVTYINR